jgi:hypothetical protein
METVKHDYNFSPEDALKRFNKPERVKAGPTLMQRASILGSIIKSSDFAPTFLNLVINPLPEDILALMQTAENPGRLAILHSNPSEQLQLAAYAAKTKFGTALFKGDVTPANLGAISKVLVIPDKPEITSANVFLLGADELAEDPRQLAIMGQSLLAFYANRGIANTLFTTTGKQANINAIRGTVFGSLGDHAGMTINYLSRQNTAGWVILDKPDFRVAHSNVLGMSSISIVSNGNG